MIQEMIPHMRQYQPMQPPDFSAYKYSDECANGVLYMNVLCQYDITGGQSIVRGALSQCGCRDALKVPNVNAPVLRVSV